MISDGGCPGRLYTRQCGGGDGVSPVALRHASAERLGVHPRRRRIPEDVRIHSMACAYTEGRIHNQRCAYVQPRLLTPGKCGYIPGLPHTSGFMQTLEGIHQGIRLGYDVRDATLDARKDGCETTTNDSMQDVGKKIGQSFKINLH